MKILKIIFLFFFIFKGVFISAQPSSKTDAITGNWITEENESIVEIFKKNNKYYGKIVWLNEPYEENGKPKKDTKNPNEELRNEPIMGIVFMNNFVYDENNIWDSGKVYDPESGNTYSGTLTLKDNNTLYLRGYIGFSIFGRTAIWKRKSKL
ncbi:MAG: DUF2147 domain-containing protein [Bacteroidales bacterium]|nr:DUF2147 domain-containing protein [Bacteroidales bacterium]